jgi:hypothetical protein
MDEIKSDTELKYTIHEIVDNIMRTEELRHECFSDSQIMMNLALALREILKQQCAEVHG